MVSLSFEQWIEFTFGTGDHVRPLDGDYPGAPREALSHCIRFLEDSRNVLDRIPFANAVPALEDFPGINGYGGLMSLPLLPEPDRLHFADAQFAIFRDAFSKEPFGDSAFFWWERQIGASWDDGPTVQSDRRVCDRIVRVLFQILDLDCAECIRSALHGLSDFGPNSNVAPDVVHDRIRSAVLSRPGVSLPLRDYAQKVIEGNVQ